MSYVSFTFRHCVMLLYCCNAVMIACFFFFVFFSIESLLYMKRIQLGA